MTDWNRFLEVEEHGCSIRPRQQGAGPIRTRRRGRGGVCELSPGAGRSRHHPHRNPARAARPRHRVGTGAGRAAADPCRWIKGHRRLRFCGGLFAQASGVCGSGGVSSITFRHSGMRHLAQARNPYSRSWLWIPGSLVSLAPRNDEDMTDHYDALETRGPAMREADLFARLPDVLRRAMAAPAYAERLKGIDPARITSRAALARLPVLRKADLPALHKVSPPFGGFVTGRPGSFGRLFTSPGPIFEPEPTHVDPWRGARALFAAGFRPGDVVLNT